MKPGLKRPRGGTPRKDGFTCKICGQKMSSTTGHTVQHRQEALKTFYGFLSK